MAEYKVLIVDDVADMRWTLANVLRRAGYVPLEADDIKPALATIERDLPDAVILDVQLPGGSGIDALKHIKQNFSDLPVIMMTGYANISLAVEAMKFGAYNFLEKPFKSNDQVLVTLERALEERRLKAEVQRLRTQLGAITELSELMGHSEQIKRVIDQVNSVAETDFTVVLYGETGAGKELVARAIHEHSPRKDHEFIAVDCGSIPETLIESELFGHEKGAFTGADRMKEGQFELASGGTLFLDEIGNLPLPMQSKILRAIETKSIRRLGSKNPIKVDIRIIAAGNRKLDELVSQGDFREDLYYRLTEFTIEIPPLRKRKEDIIYLTKRFIDATNQELNKQVRGLSPEALEAIERYDWPGNVRELRNVIRRAVLLADDQDLVKLHHFSGIQSSPAAGAADENALPGGLEIDYDVEADGFSLKSVVKDVVEKVERHVMADVLRRAGGNKSKAARILQIDYKTMHYKLKEYGLGAKD
jgi:two-component system nitrogen regulation response regulator GlnG